MAQFLNCLFEETCGKRLPIDVRTDPESLCSTVMTVKRPRDLRLYAEICHCEATARALPGLQGDDEWYMYVES